MTNPVSATASSVAVELADAPRGDFARRRLIALPSGDERTAEVELPRLNNRQRRLAKEWLRRRSLGDA